MKLELNSNQKNALATMINHPGYEAILDVMEKLVKVAEHEHLAKRPDEFTIDPDKLAFSHARQLAMRDFFTEVQKEIKAQAESALAPKVLQTDSEQDTLRAITQVI